MSSGPVVTPNQVLAQIELAKKLHPDEDNLGLAAFRINYDAARDPDMGVIYYPFEINLDSQLDSKKGWAPLNMKFKNMNCGKILPPKERKYPGVKLTYHGSTTYNDEVEVVEDGKKVKKVVVQQYGKAKVAISRIQSKLCEKGLEEGLIDTKYKTVNTMGVQFERESQEGKKKVKVALSDEVVRVDIPFVSVKGEDGKPTIKATAEPRCEIFDASRRLKDAKPNQLPYHKAEVPEGDKDAKDKKYKKLVYMNIHEFITPGSATSGVDGMNSVSVSKSGVGVSSKVSLLIVKPSTGRAKIDATKVFSAEEFNDFADAETKEEEEEEVKENGTPKSTPVKKSKEEEALEGGEDFMGEGTEEYEAEEDDL